ncbi:DNA repair protein RecN [Paenibacillus baekrokdamisoli]|uniref:DNA repair protein RecN n=1 Tax=Paenibacillus baekrokdamisoli TaxID=1712516 RepID=A0A3G9JDL6_9BACL|nr:DNA repair protein RecN [Paenibacillus baekrokdamisoli]MBB3070087.1 DNA repair protein RecN (Recombination protein N) [Paenibacillus baekrokdamisoli]BBH21099.1 DNA repair protein RecN [Paenibacillus baekrokdamisoli]
MLRELSIRNLAVVESVTVRFYDGFHVLTGETGAGKSILIDALSLVVGGRGSSDMVRYGCDKAEIEAMFELPRNHPVWGILQSFGIDARTDEGLVIRRELSSQGKSVSRVNGHIVTMSMLREAGECLVNIHGQHEHQSLFRTEKHLDWLDSYAGDKVSSILVNYKDAFRQHEKIRHQLRELEDSSRQNMQMLDLYRFQIEEIESARLKAGEDELLAEEKLKLVSSVKRRDASSEAYTLLYGNKGLDAISRAISRITDIREYDPELLGPLLEQLQSSFYQLEDASFQLRDYRDGVDSDPERLNFIDDRLDFIHSLKRKYGESIPDILTYLDRIQSEADKIENRDEHLARLQAEQARLHDEAIQLGKELSVVRQEAANRLAAAIEAELRQLQMERTTFCVELHQQAEGESYRLYANGIDEAAFLIAPNPGEPLKPLNKIASGGEMSRIMLALKTIFASIDLVPVLVFDEVDTGVSGRAAQAIAEKMSRLSTQCQVFSITHLPQVACMADHHYEIRKTIVAERTSTLVTELENMTRIEELARMLGGVEVTEKTRHHAQEMLDLAFKQKGA